MKNKTSKKYSKSVSDFDFHLPQSRIAQKPVTPRDRSKLLVIRRNADQDSQDSRIKHDYFFNLDKYLHAGDTLVLNDTKVIPARLFGKKETGGKVEIFLLQNTKENIWNCMISGKVKPETKILLDKKFEGTIIKRKNDDTWQVEFNKNNITSIGETPTPPYIKKKARLDRYQTIYAKDPGSVAAPTAGLHFTPRLMKKLEQKGVKIVYVTLHVGLGTFAPIRVDKIKDVKLHKEYYSVKKSAIKQINQAKRVIAVGTTSTRTLESLPVKNGKIVEKDFNNLSTDIFISPG
ncbi:tRNA preQ1(34) S-adenosylmethionine ribosyltransferase-isomerase QueA, partial [Patescibacteria group bacterium]|nr:tRNA preQ1(34) S-adenosylmethionine ribosyltransferase-isomerase QueA [Patescibacteria group bacterium]